jgi:hypothetical protein
MTLKKPISMRRAQKKPALGGVLHDGLQLPVPSMQFGLSSDELDRKWEMRLLHLWEDDQRRMLLGFEKGRAKLLEQLASVGLPADTESEKALVDVSCSSSKRDREKQGMARLALSAWAAYRQGVRCIQARRLCAVLKSAISFGCYLGQLEERISDGARRRGKGIKSKLVAEAHQRWVDDPSPKKSKKFDSETLMKYCPELKQCGPASCANMISAMKSEAKRFEDWMGRGRRAARNKVLASHGAFRGQFFSGEGFP